jgi:hypothetical protein
VLSMGDCGAGLRASRRICEPSLQRLHDGLGLARSGLKCAATSRDMTSLKNSRTAIVPGLSMGSLAPIPLLRGVS